MPQKTIYYSDELNDEFSEAVIIPRRIDASYKYGENSTLWNLKRFFLYKLITIPLSWIFLHLKYRHKIANPETLKKMKGRPFFLYGNHTNQMADPFIPVFVCSRSYVYVIVHPNNVSIPVIGRFIPYIGAVPLPDDMTATKNFTDYLKMRIAGNFPIVIYPEAHIWPFYTKIRPFSEQSFRYPVKYGLPTYCFTNTYQKRRFSLNPRIVTYIDGPFWPDGQLPPDKRKLDLRDQVYAAMDERSKLNNIELIKYVKK